VVALLLVRPENFKTKTTVFENYLFQIQTPSLENLETKFVVKIMFYSSKPFSCFSGGSFNNRATTTRHNYSRWRRPGNLKTKTSVFENYLFQIQTPSFEILETKFIVKIMFCALKLFLVLEEVSFKVAYYSFDGV